MATQGMMAHIGQETTLEAFGRTFRLGRLTLAIWNDFFAWARTVLPDPIDAAEKAVMRLVEGEVRLEAELEKIGKDNTPRRRLLEAQLATNRDMQKHYTTCGLDKSTSHLSFGSPETQSLLGSVRGQSYLLYLVLKQYQPDVSEELAYDILLSQGQAAVQAKLDVAGGVVPPGGVSKNDAAPAA